MLDKILKLVSVWVVTVESQLLRGYYWYLNCNFYRLFVVVYLPGV